MKTYEKYLTEEGIPTSDNSKFMVLHGHGERFLKEIMAAVEKQNAKKAKKALTSLKAVLNEMSKISWFK